MADIVELFADQIIKGGKAFNQRTGQYLVNHLPEGAYHAVSGSSFDPFHQELSRQELISWINHHLIFRGLELLAVFNGNEILWEAQLPPDMAVPATVV